MALNNKIFDILPQAVAREIFKLCERRDGGISDVSEIRLRLYGKSSFKLGCETLGLFSVPSAEDMESCFRRLCGGALYAHRDTVGKGYISFEGGIRVGVCGEARYDGDRLVGVGNVSSLIFRIPSRKKYDISELCRAYDGMARGLLIYSRPGAGKTTALRLLAEHIAVRRREQLAIVDTRRELLGEEWQNAFLDILSGYKRAEGIDIALRTLAPDVIMVDEIGRSEEAEAMLESLNSGVKLVATAHAGSLAELEKRKNLDCFFKSEIFDSFAGISVEDGRRVIKIGGFNG